MTGRVLGIDEAVARSSNVAGISIGTGVLRQAGTLFARHFGGTAACLVADENTWAAAGPSVEAALRDAGISVRCHVLPGLPRPKPTVALAEAIRAVLETDEATPVAIGSGVLNDVVKYAAYQLERPYLCVATAASMDGYTSAGAPLSDQGFKKTIQCRPARVILADLDVISAAPHEMTGWGYGDLAGKIPAGADWIVADALGIEPIDDVAWPMVQTPLRDWLAAAEAIARGDPAAVTGLFEGLTLVGLAMELHGSSRPASGADHQIAHLWEMEDLSFEGERVSHGACVAVGCASVLDLYEWLLAQDLARLDPDAILSAAPSMAEKRASIAATFGPGEIARRAEAETEAKHLAPDAHRRRLDDIRRTWPELRSRLEAFLLTPDRMRALLRTVGAPATAAEIGVTRGHLRRTIAGARFLRSRYTVLDLLDETGLLASAIAATVPNERAERERG